MITLGKFQLIIITIIIIIVIIITIIVITMYPQFLVKIMVLSINYQSLRCETNFIFKFQFALTLANICEILLH